MIPILQYQEKTKRCLRWEKQEITKGQLVKIPWGKKIKFFKKLKNAYAHRMYLRRRGLVSP